MSSKRTLTFFGAALIASNYTVSRKRPATSRSPQRRGLSRAWSGSGSTVGPDGALYVTEGAAGRVSRVDPQTGDITTFASGLPMRVLRRHRRGDGRRVYRQDRVRPGHALSALTSAASDVVGIYRVDGPTVSPSSRTSARSPWPIRQHRLLRPNRSPVRAGNLPWRVPGHRWAPQPRAAGHPRRRGHRVDRVRQHRPDRAGGVGQYDLHGRSRTRPSPARGRQGRGVRAEVAHRHRGRLRRQPPGRRGIWSGSHSLRALTGRLFAAALRVRRRCRIPARSCRSTGTAPSHVLSTVWTGRPRSSSSGTPPTSSPSPGKSGGSTTSRVRPTANRIEPAASGHLHLLALTDARTLQARKSDLLRQSSAHAAAVEPALAEEIATRA